MECNVWSKQGYDHHTLLLAANVVLSSVMQLSRACFAQNCLCEHMWLTLDAWDMAICPGAKSRAQGLTGPPRVTGVHAGRLKCLCYSCWQSHSHVSVKFMPTCVLRYCIAVVLVSWLCPNLGHMSTSEHLDLQKTVGQTVWFVEHVINSHISALLDWCQIWGT